MRPGRYCIRLSLVFPSAVSYPNTRAVTSELKIFRPAPAGPQPKPAPVGLTYGQRLLHIYALQSRAENARTCRGE